MTIDLTELRRLLEAATPGPWTAGPSTESCEFTSNVTAPSGHVCWTEGPHPDKSIHENYTERQNAFLIAALRNAAPALLAVVEAWDAYSLALENRSFGDVQPYWDAFVAARKALG